MIYITTEGDVFPRTRVALTPDSCAKHTNANFGIYSFRALPEFGQSNLYNIDYCMARVTARKHT
jgi:hypothetical protein